MQVLLVLKQSWAFILVNRCWIQGISIYEVLTNLLTYTRKNVMLATNKKLVKCKLLQTTEKYVDHIQLIDHHIDWPVYSLGSSSWNALHHFCSLMQCCSDALPHTEQTNTHTFHPTPPATHLNILSPNANQTVNIQAKLNYMYCTCTTYIFSTAARDEGDCLKENCWSSLVETR
jgi:hypothetical protein